MTKMDRQRVLFVLDYDASKAAQLLFELKSPRSDLRRMIGIPSPRLRAVIAGDV
jgi:hypothetical protein